MAEQLNRMGVDPNGKLTGALDVFHETVTNIIEHATEEAQGEGWRDWARQASEANDRGWAMSDRRPLAAKAGGAHGVYR